MYLLRAPYVVPMSGPCIENGALLIHGDQLLAVDRYATLHRDPRAQQATRMELDGLALMPGLVNAHCHLELTGLRGFQNPGGFTAWIQNLMEAKNKMSPTDYKRGMQEGIQNLIQTGTTCVADHGSVGVDCSPLLSSPLRGRLFLEALGVSEKKAEDFFEKGEKLEKEWDQNLFSRFSPHLSPHSAHTLHPIALRKILGSSRELFSIHLAESEEEDQMFKTKQGPMAEFLFSKIKNFLHSASALQYLENEKLLSSKILAIHCNSVDETDLNLLQSHKMAVVHCPSSHAFFKQRHFSLKELLQRNTVVALGTDSLSSGDSLSLWYQMRLAQRNYPELSAKKWLHLSTLGGAKALKMEDKIGSLEIGKKADVIGVPLQHRPSQNIYEDILQTEKVHFFMTDGKRVL